MLGCFTLSTMPRWNEFRVGIDCKGPSVANAVPVIGY
jgi:hypothetical protein